MRSLSNIHIHIVLRHVSKGALQDSAVTDGGATAKASHVFAVLIRSVLGLGSHVLAVFLWVSFRKPGELETVTRPQV